MQAPNNTIPAAHRQSEPPLPTPTSRTRGADTPHLSTEFRGWMFAAASGLFLEVTGNEILIVGRYFRERHARSLVVGVVDSLTLAIDAGQVGAKAKR